jgi:hypothetical protein
MLFKKGCDPFYKGPHPQISIRYSRIIFLIIMDQAPMSNIFVLGWTGSTVPEAPTPPFS